LRFSFTLKVLRHSSLYETTAAYVANQPSYLNAALLAKTNLEPDELLSALKDIEFKAGRDRNGVRFGPRPLDLDIIFYGNKRIQHENLVVPHPRSVNAEVFTVF
jgi:2-amino-4-hydroxy-6-hydroxymethyldihydropteridine diphosphokinase/dihydropteroate synthase